jgi:AhpD family alkylhydroperoxidase
VLYLEGQASASMEAALRRFEVAMERYAEIVADLAEPTRSLKETVPDVWSAFAGMHKAAVGDGALPATTKELIALAIAVVKQCDGCIAYHAKAAARKGATPEEVAEALGVALLMDGGTASVYGPHAWDAYREFAAPRVARVVAVQ